VLSRLLGYDESNGRVARGVTADLIRTLEHCVSSLCVKAASQCGSDRTARG
jgi:hypothetical protein